MPTMTQDELSKTDRLLIRDKVSGKVTKVIFPNGIQAGMSNAGFNKGVIFPDCSDPPASVADRLYVVTGTLFYNGTEVGTGGGAEATPGGSDTQVQYNNDGSFGGASGLVYDDTNARVGIGVSAPKTALSVVYDYASTTFENQLADGEGGGDILKYGTGTTVAGELYYLHTDGAWTDADASLGRNGGSQLLAVALGTNPSSNGMLLKGLAKIASTLVNGTASVGYPVFVSTTAGEYTFTAPSSSNNFVRIVGYCLDIDSSDILLYFNPDSTWVEIS